jgi:hypothetical protein
VDAKIEELLGKTMVSVKNVDNEQLVFTTTDGHQYKFFHIQDCFECVRIIDIAGHLDDLVGQPLLMAEKSTNKENPPEGMHDESFTWTFYRFATVKGYVTVRWLGESSGLYSEDVDFVKDC